MTRALVWALLLYPQATWSQTFAKECDPADARSCVQPLAAGELAPFDGQLLTMRRAAKLAAAAGACSERLKLELEREKEISSSELDYVKAVCAAEQASAKTQQDLLMRRIAALESETGPSWLPMIIAGASMIGSVSMLVLSICLIKSAK